MPAIKPSAVGLVLIAALLGALGQLFFKTGAVQLDRAWTSWLLNWRLLVGLALYGLATILFVYVLKSTPLSIAYPIIATSYIWVALLAWAFLGEPFLAYKWLGVFLIVAGIVVITR